jgi:hypothetical protein
MTIARRLGVKAQAPAALAALRRRPSALYTSTAKMIGTSICETTMRPNLALDVKSFWHRPVYISLVIVYTKYTGRRQNDFNVHAEPQVKLADHWIVDAEGTPIDHEVLIY